MYAIYQVCEPRRTLGVVALFLTQSSKQLSVCSSSMRSVCPLPWNEARTSEPHLTECLSFPVFIGFTMQYIILVLSASSAEVRLSEAPPRG